MPKNWRGRNKKMSTGKLFKFYQSPAWRHIAELYRKQQHYTCERCGEPGNVVHHKVRLTMDNLHNPEVVLNTDNFELLCRSCHEKEHNRKAAEPARVVLFDANGQVVGLRSTPRG